jgi:hypothetical protein
MTADVMVMGSFVMVIVLTWVLEMHWSRKCQDEALAIA